MDKTLLDKYGLSESDLNEPQGSIEFGATGTKLTTNKEPTPGQDNFLERNGLTPKDVEGKLPNYPINEMHPALEPKLRAAAKFGQGNPRAVADTLRQAGFEAKPTSSGEWAIRKGTGPWYGIEEKGGIIDQYFKSGGWREALMDLADILPETIRGATTTAGAIVGGGAGLPTGPGAVATGMVGAAGGAAVGEGINQGIGAYYGLRPTAGEAAGDIGKEAGIAAAFQGATSVVAPVVRDVLKEGTPLGTATKALWGGTKTLPMINPEAKEAADLMGHQAAASAQYANDALSRGEQASYDFAMKNNLAEVAKSTPEGAAKAMGIEATLPAEREGLGILGRVGQALEFPNRLATKAGEEMFGQQGIEEASKTQISALQDAARKALLQGAPPEQIGKMTYLLDRAKTGLGTAADVNEATDLYRNTILPKLKTQGFSDSPRGQWAKRAFPQASQQLDETAAKEAASAQQLGQNQLQEVGSKNINVPLMGPVSAKIGIPAVIGGITKGTLAGGAAGAAAGAAVPFAGAVGKGMQSLAWHIAQDPQAVRAALQNPATWEALGGDVPLSVKNILSMGPNVNPATWNAATYMMLSNPLTRKALQGYFGEQEQPGK